MQAGVPYSRFACGYSYNLRRCSACGVVSNVRSLQRRHEPWHCVWCKAVNDALLPRDDQATATLGDLAADVASHGLDFVNSQSQQARNAQPVLTVTTNQEPGCDAPWICKRRPFGGYSANTRLPAWADPTCR